jgi:hypothetical protein
VEDAAAHLRLPEPDKEELEPDSPTLSKYSLDKMIELAFDR